MKKFFASISLALAIFGIGCSQNTTGEEKKALGPAIEFSVTEHDFGTIKQGDDGTFNFAFTNTGVEPLVLSNVRSSCGCTIPQWPREPINAGESSEIKVNYDTRRIGNFSKSISVYSNANEEPIVLHIRGTVEGPNEQAAAAD